VVHRDAREYAFTVSFAANGAETVAEHLEHTAGMGFTNVNSESMTVTKNFAGTTCNLDISSFEFVSYSEETDYTGNMNAEFTGSVYAETACSDVTFRINLLSEDETKVGSHVLVASEYTLADNVFTFDAVVSGPNLKSAYKGRLIAEDTTHPGEK